MNKNASTPGVPMNVAVFGGSVFNQMVFRVNGSIKMIVQADV